MVLIVPRISPKYVLSSLLRPSSHQIAVWKSYLYPLIRQRPDLDVPSEHRYSHIPGGDSSGYYLMLGARNRGM